MNIDIFKDYPRTTYNKGETIYLESSLCDTLSIILDGVVKISSYTTNGKEIVYNTLLKGDMFGINLLFSNEPYYRGNVIAQTNVVLVNIKKNDLLFLLTHNETFLKDYLNYQSNFSLKLNAKLKLMTFTSLEDRLYYYFDINHNKIHLRSIKELASTLNVSREALSRLINTMIKDNTIIKDNNYLILNDIGSETDI